MRTSKQLNIPRKDLFKKNKNINKKKRKKIEIFRKTLRSNLKRTRTNLGITTGNAGRKTSYIFFKQNTSSYSNGKISILISWNHTEKA